MSNLYITNSFSINMLNGSQELSFSKIGNPEPIVNNSCPIGCIGHESTATLIEKIFNSGGIDAGNLFNRVSITPDFNGGDRVLVCQYSGPRLPEGTTELPSGAGIEFWVVEGK